MTKVRRLPSVWAICVRTTFGLWLGVTSRGKVSWCATFVAGHRGVAPFGGALSRDCFLQGLSGLESYHELVLDESLLSLKGPFLPSITKFKFNNFFEVLCEVTLMVKARIELMDPVLVSEVTVCA